jgi:hypothetical protein
MPRTAPQEAEAAGGGPLDRWLAEKEGRESRKNHT